MQARFFSAVASRGESRCISLQMLGAIGIMHSEQIGDQAPCPVRLGHHPQSSRARVRPIGAGIKRAMSPCPACGGSGAEEHRPRRRAGKGADGVLAEREPAHAEARRRGGSGGGLGASFFGGVIWRGLPAWSPSPSGEGLGWGLSASSQSMS